MLHWKHDFRRDVPDHVDQKMREEKRVFGQEPNTNTKLERHDKYLAVEEYKTHFEWPHNAKSGDCSASRFTDNSDDWIDKILIAPTAHRTTYDDKKTRLADRNNRNQPATLC